ncbi:MAG TPA: hypothetical protein VFK06_06745 [Candidatus Angelobacter sp.]|nr:hypothetical protein [Candidatus Angelobacter sp.]
MTLPIKDWLIKSSFIPVAQQPQLNRRDYHNDAVCAELPSSINTNELLNLIDTYTRGNGEAIINSDSDQHRLILPHNTLTEVRANLRAEKPQKFSSIEEMAAARKQGR